MLPKKDEDHAWFFPRSPIPQETETLDKQAIMDEGDMVAILKKKSYCTR
jgi:hypothetical protein